MRLVLTALLVVALFMVQVPSAACAQPEEDWVAQALAGVKAHEERRYGHAERLLTEVLKRLDELGHQGFRRAFVLHWLAGVHSAQGRYAQAEDLYRKALAVAATPDDPNTPQTVATMMNLAGVYYHRSEPERAERLYQQALRTMEKSPAAYRALLGKALNNMGALYFRQGRFGEAEVYVRQAVAAFEASSGSDHLDVALALENLAMVLRHVGNAPEATTAASRATAIRHRHLGKTSE